MSIDANACDCEAHHRSKDIRNKFLLLSIPSWLHVHHVEYKVPLSMSQSIYWTKNVENGNQT